MNLVGYRKFTATIASLSSATVLVWFDKIGDQVYSAVVIATVGAFIAGNVAQKFRSGDAPTQPRS